MRTRLHITNALQLALSLAVGLGALPALGAIDTEYLKQREKQVQQLVEKVLPCTVCIRSPRGQGSGSGVIVSADGLILTAAHVTAATGEELIIIFPDGRRVKGKALGANRGRDAGMARITDKGEYEFVEIGKSGNLKKNDWCVSLGHAGGFDEKRTPPVRIGRVIANRHFIMSDCTLIGGDSGGPLFDLDGQLIGIHSNIGASLVQNQHVPIDVYHDDWQRMEKGETWGSMRGNGLSPNSPVLGVQLNPQPVKGGVGLVSVIPGSPADKVGLQAQDVITSVDGKKVTTMAAVIAQVRKKKPGQNVKLTVRRGEETMNFVVRLVRAADLRPKAKPPQPEDSKPEDGDPEDSKPEDGESKDGESKDGESKDGESEDGESEDGEPGDSQPAEGPGDTDANSSPDVVDPVENESDPSDEDDVTPAPGETDGPKAPDDDAPAPDANGGPEAPDDDAAPAKGPRSVQDLLKQARENGGRLQLTPQELQRLQQHMAKRLGRGGRMTPPPTLANDKWFEEMIAAYVPIVEQAAASTYRVLVDSKQTALATAISERTLMTKASEIDGKDFEVEIDKQRTLAGKIIQTFPAYDLALVGLDEDALTPAQLRTGDAEFPLGTFVAAVDEDAAPSAIGVISVESRSLIQAQRGYLGVGMHLSDAGIALRQIVPKSPAHKAGMKVGDVILSVDGKEMDSTEQLAKLIGGHKPGDKIVFQLQRGKQELSVRVQLADRSKAAGGRPSRVEMMNRMGGRLSDTRSGFPLALQHDCPLPPADCGGPLVNLDGEVIGINVARAGRIKSYAIPVDVIAELLKTVDNGPAPKPAEVAAPVLAPAEPSTNQAPPMTITVHYTTQLKAALSTASEQLDIDASAHVRDVLNTLHERHGAAFGDLVFAADGQLLPSILLCLGDQQIPPTHGDPLQDGDVLTLLSAISGG